MSQTFSNIGRPDRFRPSGGRYSGDPIFPIADVGCFGDAESMSEDNLSWLSQWYLAQCDSDWEHSYGVTIDTLDNPGWSLKVELADTALEGRAFDRVANGQPSDDLEEWRRAGSWWIATVSGNVFEAHGGPLDLAAIIGIFRQWVEQTSA